MTLFEKLSNRMSLFHFVADSNRNIWTGFAFTLKAHLHFAELYRTETKRRN